MVSVNYQLNEFDIDAFPEFLRMDIFKTHEQKVPFLKRNYSDFESGIWVFISGHKNNQSLNHLQQRVPCWEAELPDDTIVYDVSWTK